MSERKPSSLTPEQAADVIRYYHDGNNAEARRNGWSDKVALGRSAIQTILKRQTIIPQREGEQPQATLTPDEMHEGLNLIQAENGSNSREANSHWPVELTNEQWIEVERISDNTPCSIYDAYYRYRGVKPPK